MPTCLLSLSVSQGLGSNTENRMKGGRDDSSMVQQEDSISCSVFLLQLSLFSPTVVAAVAQGIGRSHHRHSNVVLNIVLPWLWEVARSGVQDSGNIQNLSGVLRWSWHVLTATHQSQTKEAALQDIARWLTNADSIASRMSRTSQPSSPRDYISLIYIYSLIMFALIPENSLVPYILGYFGLPMDRSPNSMADRAHHAGIAWTGRSVGTSSDGTAPWGADGISSNTATKRMGPCSSILEMQQATYGNMLWMLWVIFESMS